MGELLEQILQNCQARAPMRCRPSPKAMQKILENLQILLFPAYFRQGCEQGSEEAYLSSVLADTVCRLQWQLSGLTEDAGTVCLEFLSRLPLVHSAMEQDLQAFLEGDPAAAGRDEIIISYPGFYAIWVQRLAHILWGMEIPLVPRMMTELAHSATGIDIHPGAVLGQAFFIDHGTGVVIGETACIGDHVKLYQGVTLGALSTRGGQTLRGKKRHPTLEDGVTVYAGASILGGETVIGAGSTIGANAFVTGSVEPGTVVIGHRPGP